MRKEARLVLVCISLILIFSISFVSAGAFSDFWNKITGKSIFGSSVSGVLSEVIDSVNSYGDISIVYGDNAALEDFLGAFMISDILPIFDEDRGREPYVRKASEIISFQNKNLILVGGPCANQISEQITNEIGYNCDDWKFDYGKAIVKVFENGDGKVIMVAGTTKGDTWKMSDAIRRYSKSDKLKSSDEVIFDTPAEGECGNNICETKETDKNCPADCSNEGSVQLTSGLIVKTFDVFLDYVIFSDGEGDVYLQNLKTKELKKIDQGSWPEIDGDYVVYNSMNEVLNENTGEYVRWPTISLYQISTEETTSLTEAKIRYYFEQPMIFGNNVVWLERNEVYEDRRLPKLMIYNIETKSTRKLVDVRNYWDGNFRIYGDKIVYQGPKYCIPENCSQVRIEISPTRTRYENAEAGDDDIWLYDMTTDKKTRLTSNEEYQGMPEIWNNFIVWVDDRLIAEGKREIYMYNILTGEEKPLNLTYDVSGGHTAISFSDYNVIWTDYRNSDELSSNEDVYFYNIQGDTERRITLNSDNQGGGKLSGNYVVWIDHRNREEGQGPFGMSQDLFMLEL